MKKQKSFKIVSFLLVFSLLCGFVMSPQNYNADEIYSYSAAGDEIKMISYIKDTGSMCNITSTPSISTTYKTFRLWIYFGAVVPKGSVVDVDFKLLCGPGTIGSVVGWFGIQRGQGYETSTVCSADTSFNYGGTGSGCHSLNKITLTGDASAFCVDVTFSSRTTSSIYLNVNGFSVTGTAPDPVADGLDNLNTTSNSLLDNIKNLFTGQSSIFSYLKSTWNYVKELPANIAVSLTSLFTPLIADTADLLTGQTDIFTYLKSTWSYVKSLHVNIANSISGFFVSLGDSINETMTTLFNSLPEGIKNKLSSLFVSIVNSIDIVGKTVEGLKSGQITLGDVFNAGMSALKKTIDSFPDKLGEFFSPLTSGISNIFSGLFKMSDEDKKVLELINNGQISGYMSPDEISEVLNDAGISSSKVDAPFIDEFLDGTPARLSVKVMGFIFSFTRSYQYLYAVFALALVSYVFFGKR